MTTIESTSSLSTLARASERSSDWLTRKQATAYLCRIGCTISVRTLEKLAANKNAGNGPPFTRTRTRTIRYLRADLDAWGYRNTERVL